MGKIDTIEIRRDGRVAGRVHFGARVSDAAAFIHAALSAGRTDVAATDLRTSERITTASDKTAMRLSGCAAAVADGGTADMADAAIKGGGKCFLIYDIAAESYAAELAGAVGFAGTRALRNVSEAEKTVDTVQDLCRWLLALGADRDALVVAMGGGIVTDIVGFAAAVYKRGVRCAYIPTTLLAQVDAAIGGKTGVNMDSYKNIIGVFKQPEFTFICPQPLESLPDPVFRSGLAELLKTFIIDNGTLHIYKGIDTPVSGENDADGGADGYQGEDNGHQAANDGEYREAGESQEEKGRVARLLDVVRKINSAGGFAAAPEAVRDEFGTLVAEAAAVKAGIVSRDEFEGGERRKLNLGHTFAHAIEYNANLPVRPDPSDSETAVNPSALPPSTATRFPCVGGEKQLSDGITTQIVGEVSRSATAGFEVTGSGESDIISHGEAVAVGIAMAARLSVRMGIAGPQVETDIVNALKLCGLPTECPFPVKTLAEAMRKDKKAEGGIIHVILIRSIGDVAVRDMAVTEIEALLEGSENSA